jgi:multiple sugar transport system permease protein
MSSRGWAASVAAAAAVAAAVTLVVVMSAQRRYERAFAFRIAGTTAAYIAAVTPPPPPPPPPRRPRPVPRGRRRTPAPPPPPTSAPTPLSPAARAYHLPSLLTQARALRTLPGWSSDVEVYFGTAPLVDATAAPLSLDDLVQLEAGGRWHDGAALVPLKDRDGQEVVGAVAVRPLPAPHGPLPGGFGFAVPAAIIAVGAAAVLAFRERSLRRGGYVGAALLLALAAYVDVRAAARQSTDRWLIDTRRLLQEAATRLPPPRVPVALTHLASMVRDGEIVAGEPAESAPRRVHVHGERRAVVAVLIGSGRWVELRSVPGELEAPRWLILLVPCAVLGPIAIVGLRWAQRTPLRSRRETAIAWGFLAPAASHLTIFTIGPAIYTIYLASSANLRTLVHDPLTWNSLVTSAAYALYVPISIALALAAALAVQRYQQRWGGRLLSAAFLLPYVASVVAIAVLWQAIYRAGSLGLGRPDWLSNPHTALLALMLVSIWAHVGGQMIVFLGGLQAIPQSYVDAALVDGAGAWRCFWRVTLPLLRPMTWFVFLTGVIGALQMFTLVLVITQGGPLPLHSTDVLVHRIYRTAFGPQALGMASALALMLAAVLLVFRWPQLKLLRRQVRHA